MKLAPDERARIVAELLASLEPDVPSDRRTEAEGINEIERRARAAIAGNPGVRCATAFDQNQSQLSPPSSALRLSPEAVDELVEAVEWYRTQWPGLKMEFLTEVRRAGFALI